MKQYLKIILVAAAALVVAVAVTFAVATSSHNRTLRKEVSHQQTVIDSLLTLDRTFMTVQLCVTDRSVNRIYGRYNKGTILMPSAKTYLLQIDSATVKK